MYVNLLQATEDVSKNLAHIKGILYGVGDQEPQTELVAQLSQEMYNNNMLHLLIQNLHKVDFEVNKVGKGLYLCFDESSKDGHIKEIFLSRKTFFGNLRILLTLYSHLYKCLYFCYRKPMKTIKNFCSF